jgi:hypothetical protein
MIRDNCSAQALPRNRIPRLRHGRRHAPGEAVESVWIEPRLQPLPRPQTYRAGRAATAACRKAAGASTATPALPGTTACAGAAAFAAGREAVAACRSPAGAAAAATAAQPRQPRISQAGCTASAACLRCNSPAGTSGRLRPRLPAPGGRGLRNRQQKPRQPAGGAATSPLKPQAAAQQRPPRPLPQPRQRPLPRLQPQPRPPAWSWPEHSLRAGPLGELKHTSTQTSLP